MSKKSNWGDPCILMGDIFIKLVDDCAQNSFEVSLMYCGAVEYYLKAKDIDKSSRNIKIADKKIKNYSVYFPKASDITLGGYSIGDKYLIDCVMSFEIIIAKDISSLQHHRR